MAAKPGGRFMIRMLMRGTALVALVTLPFSAAANAQIAVSANDNKIALIDGVEHGAGQSAPGHGHDPRHRRVAAKSSRRAAGAEQRGRRSAKRRGIEGGVLRAGDVGHEGRSGRPEEDGAGRQAFGDRPEGQSAGRERKPCRPVLALPASRSVRPARSRSPPTAMKARCRCSRSAARHSPRPARSTSATRMQVQATSRSCPTASPLS